VLNSPGGSVADAIAMGRLIREKHFNTEIAAGKLCASSCPLIFAGGVERTAGAKSVVGVHQIAAIKSPTDNIQMDQMNEVQVASAICERYLGEMGIDLKLWVHAMETQHDRLYVLNPAELQALKLATSNGGP
jgi:hypothetical protein